MANDTLSNFLGASRIVSDAYDRTKGAVQQNKLQALAPGVIQGDPQAYAQAAALDPKVAGQYQEANRDISGQARMAAKYLQASIQKGDPAAIAVARQQIKPYMDTLHPDHPYPLDRDPAQELPMIEAFLAQTADLDGASLGGRVQSQKVGEDGYIYNTFRDGRVVNTGVKADSRTQLRDQPGIEPSLINLRTGQASPLTTAGAAPAAPGAPGAPGGVYIDPSLPPEVRAQIQAAEAAGQPYNGTGGTGLTAPRTDPAQIITPYQNAALAGQYRDDARADRSLGLQEEAAAQRLRDQQIAAQEKRLGIQRAAQGVVDSTDDALGTIQRLRNHPGWRQIGTIEGDASTALPLVRTDAKGAQAILDTVKSQALINTLSALKQASSTGASGFGSLTEKEGAALQSSMANLSTAQSHKDLDAALGQIETILARTRNRTLDSIQARGIDAPAAPAAAPAPAPAGNIDALLDKYR